MKTTKRPRVNRKKRLVLVFSQTLEAWSLHKINLNQGVNRHWLTKYAFIQDSDKALEQMETPKNGFNTVTGWKRPKVNNWDQLVEAIWKHSGRIAL